MSKQADVTRMTDEELLEHLFFYGQGYHVDNPYQSIRSELQRRLDAGREALAAPTITLDPSWCATHGVTMKSCRDDMRVGCRAGAAQPADVEAVDRLVLAIAQEVGWEVDGRKYRQATKVITEYCRKLALVQREPRPEFEQTLVAAVEELWALQYGHKSFDQWDYAAIIRKHLAQFFRAGDRKE